MSSAPPKIDPVRLAVARALRPLEAGREKRFHLDEAIETAFSGGDFSAEDRRFATYLAYGVVRDWFRLEARIAHLAGRPAAKLNPDVRLLLRMGLFQLLSMDSVPDYAAVSTTMDLAARLKIPATHRGLINAVLRRTTREGAGPALPVEGSVPTWYYKRLRSQYTKAEVAQILAAGQAIPGITLRVNPLKTTTEAFQQSLTDAAIPFVPLSDWPGLFRLTEGVGDVRSLPGYADGHFVVQDPASAQVVPFLDPQPGERILDLGAAPGTKTSQLAAAMQNQGTIEAVDVSEARMAKLDEALRRLGISNVKSHIVSSEADVLPIEPVDRILLDAPCSGTGTLSRHPEILLVLKAADFKAYAATQLQLLHQAWGCLKPGGRLVYSTCSIDRAENDSVIEAFVAVTPDCQLNASHLLLPTADNSGFFMASLLKRDS